MTFRNELERSDLSSIDKLVEILYRNENCLFCKATGCKCPFDDIESDKDLDPDGSICKSAIKNNIIKAVQDETSK